MRLNKSNINRFLLFRLPSAYLTGVRMESIDAESAVVKVRHRWINQNPFGSLYYGVQAMAAEISTGVLVLRAIGEAKVPVSMLVVRQTAEFHKKARGLIRFTCWEDARVREAVADSLRSGEARRFVLHSTGKDESGDVVSEFEFEWSIKRK